MTQSMASQAAGDEASAQARNGPARTSESREKYSLPIEVGTLAKYMEHFTIFRVPAHMLESRKNCYEPRVVSIGPYNHGKKHLGGMEGLKEWCLESFTAANSNKTREYYVDVMKGLEGEARDCYYERPDLNENEFAEMLLLDGCFILRLMLEHDPSGRENMSNNHFIRNDLLMLENQIPFFVLEKLFKLFISSNMSNRGSTDPGSGPSTLVGLAFLYLKPAIRGLKEETDVAQVITDKVRRHKIRHLLHLHYCFMSAMASSYGNGASSSSAGRNSPSPCTMSVVVVLLLSPLLLIFFLSMFILALVFSIIFAVLGLTCIVLLFPIILFVQFCGCYHFEWRGPPERQHKYTMPSATELQEAGVILRKRKSPRSLWDVRFHNGYLCIPPVIIDESLKPLLMNLVAFEQYAKAEVFGGLLEEDTAQDPKPDDVAVDTCTIMTSILADDTAQDPEPDDDPADICTIITRCIFSDPMPEQDAQERTWKKFTAYALFMDCIVNTEKDALTLRQQGIIENMLGSEQAVADFFNHICEGVIHDEHHYLSREFTKVKIFCQSCWPRHKAKLKRDYFSNPWSCISLVAGSLVFVLTIGQAVLAILPFLKDPHNPVYLSVF